MSDNLSPKSSSSAPGLFSNNAAAAAITNALEKNDDDNDRGTALKFLNQRGSTNPPRRGDGLNDGCLRGGSPPTANINNFGVQCAG